MRKTTEAGQNRFAKILFLINDLRHLRRRYNLELELGLFFQFNEDITNELFWFLENGTVKSAKDVPAHFRNDEGTGPKLDCSVGGSYFLIVIINCIASIPT